jgi:hypothetical protein
MGFEVSDGCAASEVDASAQKANAEANERTNDLMVRTPRRLAALDSLYIGVRTLSKT